MSGGEEYREYGAFVEKLSESERVVFHRGLYFGWLRGLRSASDNGSDIPSLVQTIVRDACSVLSAEITWEQQQSLRRETEKLSRSLKVALATDVAFSSRLGEKNGGAKLSVQDVLRIREQRAQGHTQLAIARRFGIDRSMVARIAAGDNWRHVGGPITPCEPSRSRLEWDRGRAVELVRSGKSYAEAARLVGASSHSAVRKAYLRATSASGTCAQG